MRKEKVQDREEGLAFAEGLWQFALAPRERLKPPQWISRYFRHGPTGQSFDFEIFPWLLEPAESFADYHAEETLFLAPPQVGKTLLCEAGICFFTSEDPADLVAYTHTEEMAHTWGEKRLIPALKACPPIRALLPQDPKAIRKTEILFGHMVVECRPANESQTQSISRRIVMCDERWKWEAGRYDNARRRASSPIYEGRRKVCSFSNSGIYETDVEIQWRESDQRILVAECPNSECRVVHPFKFSERYCRRVPKGVKGFEIQWDENDVTRPHGVWQIDEVVKSVRLVCPSCKARHEDTPRIRAQLRKSMRYQAMNPGASSKNRAWAVSGVAVYPWGDLVKQFIRALAELDLGDNSAMKEFVLKGLNEPWSDDVIFDTTTNSTGDYALGAGFPDAIMAAMTLDYQELEPHFWFVIRDWAQDGRSRLREAGYLSTWEQVREKQKKEQIPDRYVHVDVTYDPTTVLENCAQYSWIALRGRDEDSFIHSKGLKMPVRRFFSEPRVSDPSIGTERQGDPFRRRALEILWANTPVKDILSKLFSGKGVYFGIPRDVPQFYLNQMASERKQVVEHRGSQEIRRWLRVGKRPNHLWDCEAMQIVFALIKGPLRRSAPDKPAGEESGGPLS